MGIQRNRSSFFPILVGVVTCCIAMTVTLLMTYAEYRWQRSMSVSHASEHAGQYKAILGKALAENLIVIDAVEGLLRLAPNPSYNDFQQLVKPLLDQRPTIKQVEVAPNAVIKLVYPHSEDNAIIGLDLRSLPGQRKVVEETIRSQRFRLAGPVNLIEGGYGAIARKPIFISPDGQHDGEQFWGFITLILDVNRLLSEIVSEESDTMTRYAIRGTDGLGAQGGVFFGSPDVFKQPVVTHTIPVPGGYWQLAASVDLSRISRRWEMLMFSLVGMVGSVVVGVLAGILVLQWQHLHTKATRDSLTRVYNRQRIQEMGAQEVQRAQRYNHPLSLIMIDLDSFKLINDRYGHLTGDQVLQESTDFIEHAVRGCDLVGRFGGEEFVVVLPECDVCEVAVVAERIRFELCRTLSIDYQQVNLSASLGTATLQRSECFEDMLNNADIALYEAKRTGKNRAIAFSPHLIST
ncbi:sensor domain-containing diguanylate cyclase [Pontibacterium sp. N1Y112]|uniref:diguanylate cyclase n=1 Tax=Pontibacterium sinense TaxID=2781979 RepID=A0A8J7FCX8_9GAMM|nr:diguanylate cyclase [Pontibacterium sinense]MBE9397114.1 sensor domain-containing diguanylate cyclase [Pontibacterium sinense]